MLTAGLMDDIIKDPDTYRHILPYIFHYLCKNGLESVALIRAILSTRREEIIAYPTTLPVFLYIGNLQTSSPLFDDLVKYIEPSPMYDFTDLEDETVLIGYYDYSAQIVLAAAFAVGNIPLIGAIQKALPKQKLLQPLSTYFRIFAGVESEEEAGFPTLSFSLASVDYLTQKFPHDCDKALNRAPCVHTIRALLEKGGDPGSLMTNMAYSRLDMLERLPLIQYVATKRGLIDSRSHIAMLCFDYERNLDVAIQARHAGRVIARAAEKAYLDPKYKWAQWRLRKGMEEFQNEVPVRLTDFIG